ncbi:hypothetical protein KBC70_01630 [Candidatus Woesebacteria bacterium]|nr:hypothetical protein [Candidatus Woesebacteria bacterium]
MNFDLNAINIGNIWLINIMALMFGAFIWRGKVGGINESIRGLGQDVMCLIGSIVVAAFAAYFTASANNLGLKMYDWWRNQSTIVSRDQAYETYSRMALFWTLFLTGRYMWGQLLTILKQALKEAPVIAPVNETPT